MINDEQLSFFEEFGFLVLRKLFRADEIAAIAKEVEITIQELYHGADRGTHGKWTPLQGPSTPFNGSLLEDPRFYDMARQLFGDSVIGLMSDALLWTGDTGWHRDRDVPGNTNTGLKFLYYLDPLIAETGALRVVPGSHKEPFHDDIPKAAPLCLPPASHHYMHQVKALTMQPDDVMLPSVIAETEPGDVIAFAMPLLHASFGGAPNRRLCSTVYWAESPTPEQIEIRRQEAQTIQSNHLKMFNYPADAPFCHPHWIAGARGNPIRQRWIDCLRDLQWINAGDREKGSSQQF